jgi:hypothetical protein
MPRAVARAARFILQTLAGVVGFVVGCYLTWFLAMRLIAPSSGCDAPCDGPAYLAMGLSMLASPLAGIFTGVAACLLVSHLLGERLSR